MTYGNALINTMTELQHIQNIADHTGLCITKRVWKRKMLGRENYILNQEEESDISSRD